MDLMTLSSNWKKLQSTIAPSDPKSPSTTAAGTLKRKTPPTGSQSNSHALKRRRTQPQSSSNNSSLPYLHPRKRPKQTTVVAAAAAMSTPLESATQSTTSINAGLSPTVEIGKYISLDCEMVGVGPSGHDSSLARVSIVNYNGDQIYDSFVSQKEAVTDWRTPISGIKPVHMKHARSFEEVQRDVAQILVGRVVVGHALKHDFKALLLDHPERDVRDTSRFAPYKRLAGGTPKLQLLASELLGLEIQGGEHSSLEDARACMLLFRRDKDAFESKSKTKKKRLR